jgi:CRISPR-associated protein Csd1
MILARLVELYDRLAREGHVERAGYEYQPVAYLLVLDSDGKLLEIVDTRTASGDGKRGRRFSVPSAAKRASGIIANLLWDNAEYVLGLPRDPAASVSERGKVAARHAAFRAAVDAIAVTVSADPGIVAVQAFLCAHKPDAFAATPLFARLEDRTANLSFVNASELDRLICERDAVRAFVAASETAGVAIQCLVTGKQSVPARLHPALRGVAGGQTSGVSLVSFNLAAFRSYGLTKGDNAPVGTSAAFAYGTALNWLLSERRHRLRLGQLTVVFWASKALPAETFISDLFGDPPLDETEAERSARALRVQMLLTGPRTGIVPEDLVAEFFVLGLAPNAARAAAASWQEGDLADAILTVRRWFNDLDLAGRPSFLADSPSLPFLLRALAPLGEMNRLSPRIPANVLRSALDGGRLPEEVLALALGRLRVSERPGDRYALTSLLRTILRRNHAMETTVSLDLNATDPAYRWGRLFAVFEKAQEEAQPGIDATVRDRFWSSAAATPAMVFGVLNRLNGHHLRKLEMPARVRLERLTGEIMSEIQDFPTRLSLPEQGRFALGYWHQRTAFFVRRESANSAADQAA